jgi:hypothetical protein
VDATTPSKKSRSMDDCVGVGGLVDGVIVVATQERPEISPRPHGRP